MAKRKPYQRKQDFKRKGEDVGLKVAKGIQDLDDFVANTVISLIDAVPFAGDQASGVIKDLYDSPLGQLDRKKRNVVTNFMGKTLGNYWGGVLHHLTRPLYGAFDKRAPKEDK